MTRALVLILILGIPLTAYVPRRILTSVGLAYENWADSAFPIVWRLNPTKGSNITGSRDVADLVRLGFQAWSSVSTARVSFLEGSATTAANSALDQTNLISFAPAGYSSDAAALTTVTFAGASGRDGGSFNGVDGRARQGAHDGIPGNRTQPNFHRVRDGANRVIRRVLPGPDGKVETVAGTGVLGSLDGPAQSATFSNPQGIALDPIGNLWVVDTGNHTIAGLPGVPGSVDGSGGQARFNSPIGIAVEPENLSQQLDRFFRGGSAPPVRVIVAITGRPRRHPCQALAPSRSTRPEISSSPTLATNESALSAAR